MPHDKETEEKTKDAKKNVKIDMLKSKGYSERDAILKGAKEDTPKEESPSEDMSDEKIDHMGSMMEGGTTIELMENDLGGQAPEVGSTVKLDALVKGVRLYDDGSKCYELTIKSSGKDSSSEDNSEDEV